MGMYTQVRGWLNIPWEMDMNVQLAQMKLSEAQETFKDTSMRSWVSEDTHVHAGAQGSIFIFFGTELKNYDDAERWIEHLLKYLPTAEGRFDFQYETTGIGELTPYYLVYDGEIIKKDECRAWTKGC